MTRYESFALFKKASQLVTCLHPRAGADCSGGIIKAHTIQRGGGLSSIAEEGHVVGIDHTASLGIGTKSIGVRRASTFTGFCGHHDNELFRSVETAPFDPQSREQVLLLMYRAVCMELHKKRCDARSLSVLKEHDRGKSFYQQRQLHHDLDVRNHGVRMAIRDGERMKAGCEKQFLPGDYSQTRAVIVEFSTVPDLSCSAVVAPECDFAGNRVQTLVDRTR